MPVASDNRFAMYDAWKPDRAIFIRNMTLVHMMHRDDVDKLLKHAWLKQMMTAFIVDQLDQINEHGDVVKFDSNAWNRKFTTYIYNRYRASKTFSETVPQQQRKNYSYDPQHNNVRDLMGEKPVKTVTIERQPLPDTVDADAFARWLAFQEEKNGQAVTNSYFNECLMLFSHIPKAEQSFRVANCIVGGHNKPWVKMNESAEKAKRKYVKSSSSSSRLQSGKNSKYKNMPIEGDWQPGMDSLSPNRTDAAIPRMTFAGEKDIVSQEHLDVKALQRWLQHRRRDQFANIDEQAIAEQLSKIPKAMQAEAVSYSIAGDYKQVFLPNSRHSSSSTGDKQRHSFMALARGEHLAEARVSASSKTKILNETEQLAQQFDRLRQQQNKDGSDE